MPLQKHVCNFIHPKQLSPFPERLKLPFPDEEILSGYEEDVSFFRDRPTTWVKADPDDTFERHKVDVRKAFAEYREASVRRQRAPDREYFFDSSAKPLIRSKTAERLELESRTAAWKRGCYRETHCREMARHHPARSD